MEIIKTDNDMLEWDTYIRVVAVVVQSSAEGDSRNDRGMDGSLMVDNGGDDDGTILYPRSRIIIYVQRNATGHSLREALGR